jgi:tRNA(Arg) A34 adenosine deaminase TadA
MFPDSLRGGMKKGLISMLSCSRRSVLAVIATGIATLAAPAKAAPLPKHRKFIEAAFLMKEEAVKAGDQAFGAVVVKNGRIVGFGPSRVVTNKDPAQHAERVAITEAQVRLGTLDLTGCVLYSSSRPCLDCEAAAREAKIARMYYGPDATDAGPPGGAGTRRRS